MGLLKYETQLRRMIIAASEAGQKLLGYNPSRIALPGDFVTDADLASEQVIKEVLALRFPDISFWGEEGGGMAQTVGQQWVVDPVDGTINYYHGDSHWGVSIGLVEDGHSVIGVIYLPAKRQMFWAQKGFPARVVLVGEDSSIGKPMALKIGEVSKLAKPLILVEWVKEQNDGHDYQRVINILFDLGRKGFLYPQVRNASTASLMMVATGQAGGFVHLRPEPFDIAAGCLIVEQAGGTVTDLSGNPWSPFAVRNGIVASNGVIHEDLLSAVNS